MLTYGVDVRFGAGGHVFGFNCREINTPMPRGGKNRQSAPVPNIIPPATPPPPVPSYDTGAYTSDIHMLMQQLEELEALLPVIRSMVSESNSFDADEFVVSMNSSTMERQSHHQHGMISHIMLVVSEGRPHDRRGRLVMIASALTEVERYMASVYSLFMGFKRAVEFIMDGAHWPDGFKPLRDDPHMFSMRIALQYFGCEQLLSCMMRSIAFMRNDVVASIEALWPSAIRYSSIRTISRYSDHDGWVDAYAIEMCSLEFQSFEEFIDCQLLAAEDRVALWMGNLFLRLPSIAALVPAMPISCYSYPNGGGYVFDAFKAESVYQQQRSLENVHMGCHRAAFRLIQCTLRIMRGIAKHANKLFDVSLALQDAELRAPPPPTVEEVDPGHRVSFGDE